MKSRWLFMMFEAVLSSLSWHMHFFIVFLFLKKSPIWNKYNALNIRFQSLNGKGAFYRYWLGSIDFNAALRILRWNHTQFFPQKFSHRNFSVVVRYLPNSACSLLRYIATSLQLKKGSPKKIPPSLLRHNLRKMTSEKKCPLATSLLRYNLWKMPPEQKYPLATSLLPSEKWTLKKNTPSLHRYFATIPKKVFLE